MTFTSTKAVVAGAACAIALVGPSTTSSPQADVAASTRTYDEPLQTLSLQLIDPSDMSACTSYHFFSGCNALIHNHDPRISRNPAAVRKGDRIVVGAWNWEVSTTMIRA